MDKFNFFPFDSGIELAYVKHGVCLSAPKGRFNTETGLLKDKMVPPSPHGDRATYLSDGLIRPHCLCLGNQACSMAFVQSRAGPGKINNPLTSNLLCDFTGD